MNMQKRTWGGFIRENEGKEKWNQSGAGRWRYQKGNLFRETGRCRHWSSALVWPEFLRHIF